MGRHGLIDLCQTHSRIPKHLVRDNVNFLVLFRQDEMNLKHIYDDHVNTDMPYSKFKELCSACWNNGKMSSLLLIKIMKSIKVYIEKALIVL